MRSAKAAIATLAILLAAPLAGQNVPSQQRGLSADTAYQLGEVDHVNLFSGGLSLTLPIGGQYPVGPGFGYGLTLSYNLKGWDYPQSSQCLDANNKPHVFTVATLAPANAGFGWNLHLGKLDGSKYIAPDGSEHFFHDELHPGYGDLGNGVYYTQNSTYLRQRNLSSGCAGGGSCRIVEFPDGSVKEFKNAGGNNWRLTRWRDSFGHYLDVTYSSLKWTLTDEHGREHEILFKYVNLLEVIDRVRLKTFGGVTSEWVFEYEYADLPIQDYDPPNCFFPPPAATTPVALLSKVTLPDTSYFEMAYSRDWRLDQPSGGITSLRLPTGGKMAWEYGRYYFQSIEIPVGTETQNWTSAVGVKKRETYLAASDAAPHGTWTYEQEEGGFGIAPGDIGETPCWSKTTVRDPAGNETVNYFATQKSVHPWAYGLPFTFCDPSNNNTYSATGPWVSQELYQGTGADGTKSRTIKLEYEGDGPNGQGYQDKNLRLSKTRTVFHDDGNRWQETTFSDFDGLGHYRTTTQTGNFWASNPTRTTTQHFNRDNGTLVINRDTSNTTGSTFVMPAENARWQLGTYDVATVTESGITWRADTCFDDRGFLKWRRNLTSFSPQAVDVLVVYTENGESGRVSHEQVYGGDGASLTTTYSIDNICEMSLPTAAPLMDTRFTYETGVIAEKWIRDGETDLLSLTHQEIDSSTGLPAAIYDSAGVGTLLNYDTLGRMTSEKPESDAWSRLTYQKATTTGPKIISAICSNEDVTCSEATALIYSTTEYDGLARPIRDTVKYPASTGVTSESRKFTWSALGWKLFESTWGDEGLGTTWSDHDRFGRPGTEQLPGKNPSSLFRYLGARASMRQERIVTGFSGAQTWEHKAELFDHLGRRVEICEGMNAWWSGSCTGSITQYSYSPRNQLTKVCSNLSGSTCGQERYFTYDGRGFLTAERQPEIGPNGNGWKTFTYDGAGRMTGRSITGAPEFGLTYRYDAVGRLLELRQASPDRPLKEFFYARTNDGDNLRRGKLVRAVRHNWVSPTSPIFPNSLGQFDFIVSDHYEYRGRGGRLSERVTSQRFGSGTRAFRSGYTWNELGQLETIEYPTCLEWPCETRVPARQVAFGYDQGRLTSLAGFASMTYQLGGTMLYQIHHSNGVTWTQAINPGDRQLRPSSFTTSGVTGGQNWSTGTYDFDGVWNVHQIDTAQYRYDRQSRLVEGQIVASGLKTQTAAFDAYGNLTSLVTDGVTQTLTPVATTNRLSGATYDAAGNMTAINLGGVTFNYGFDALGQMELMKSNANQAKVFFYDAADERLLTWDCPLNSCGEGSAYERWTVRGPGAEVLRAFEGQRSDLLAWKEDFIYAGKKAIAAIRPNGSTGQEDVFAIHHDHLGSTRQVTGPAGNEVERHTFFPFGQEATTAVATDIALKFTGHERDHNRGGKGMLDYMHARSCSPVTGRFLSTDPGAGSPGSPRSWNLYSYVLGNPLKFVDPFGWEPAATFYDTIKVIARPEPEAFSFPISVLRLMIGGHFSQERFYHSAGQVTAWGGSSHNCSADFWCQVFREVGKNAHAANWAQAIMSDLVVARVFGGLWVNKPGLPPMYSQIEVLSKRVSFAEVKNAMASGSFDFGVARGRMGGYADDAGNYLIGEGNHRMRAAIEIFQETGDPMNIFRLLENGNWQQVGSFATHNPRPLPTQWMTP